MLNRLHFRDPTDEPTGRVIPIGSAPAPFAPPAAHLLDSIGGLIGGIAVAAGAAGKGGKKQHKQALDVWQKLQTSNFDFTALDPPELRILSEAMPEVYEAVIPPEFRQVVDSEIGRAGQLSTLGQFQDVAREGLPIVDRLRAQEAARSVAGASAAGQQAALRNLSARGALSSGDEIQARLAGNQQGTNLARDLGSDLAEQAALRRLAGMEGAGQAAGALRAGDVSVSAQNADIANRFSQIFSQLKTQQAADAAAARERAQAYNVQQTNQTGQANTQNQYNVNLANLQRQNELRAAQFGQNLQKTAGLSGAYNQYANYKDAIMQQRAQGLVSAGQGAGGATEGLLGGII